MYFFTYSVSFWFLGATVSTTVIHSRKHETLFLRFTEIRNPALHNFRVAAGTETEANRLALIVALVLKGSSSSRRRTYSPASFETVIDLTVGSLPPTTREEDRWHELITTVVVAIAIRALQLFVK